ncbi:MAG: hypothetical protein LQ339_007918 [Xanthoria mediterranea]|nr:MAG: hypothetical protein LQ339_007918 [Xanthoria mediterranea]
MIAESLGTNLLREVRVEGLDELLRSLRSKHEPQKPRIYTSEPAIGELLNIFAGARDRLSHHQHQTPVLELVGSSPCSGKTQLLYYLIARLLLPSTHEELRIGGKNTAVILFDLSNSFSLLRLRDIILGSIRAHNPPSLANKDTLNTIIHTSLTHLHIFRPQSSSSFLSTLQSLQNYILNIHAHISANRPVGAIALHSIDAFLHQDRLDDADAATLHSPTTNSPAAAAAAANLQPYQRFRDLVSHLRTLQLTFSTPIIATSSALASLSYQRLSDGHSVPLLPSHLPAVWRNYVSVRLICQRETIRKFQHGVSVQEVAGREAALRREAVEKGRFVAMVDWSESEGWREDVRGRVGAMRGDGEGIGFRVLGEGVFVG